jgi:hypothetical protein
MAKSPAEMIEAVLRNLPKNTGKSAEQWTALLRKSGAKAPKEQYSWLREVHGVGHVAARVLSGGLQGYDAPEALVDAQYAGERASLRPVYEAVLRAAKRLGPGVAAKPCKTYVPLHNTKTFAVIKAERSRVNLGLCLSDKTKPAGRLLPAAHLGSDRVTHKLELRSAKDVDAEVVRWLRVAYEGG